VTPAIQQLDSLGIRYRTVSYDHDPTAVGYGAEAADALGLDPDTVFKTLVAEVDGSLVVACVPVSTMLDLKALARAAGGKRAVMADPVVAERSTGYVVGGISPLGQRRRQPTFIDELCDACDEIHVSGGRRGLEIVLRPSDLVAALDATVAPLAGR
jgi:Cys-tRNA(Pro)/Cys-tRNA(Cys) deacylase